MSRIIKALGQGKPGARRLRLVESIDGATGLPGTPIDRAGDPAEARRRRIIWLLPLLMAAAGLALGYQAWRMHRKSAAAAQARQKDLADEHLEQLRSATDRFNRQDYEGALAQFRRLLEESPPQSGLRPILLIDLGMAYKARHDARQARRYYLEAIQADPRSWVGYNNLGMLDAELGDWDSAIVSLRKAFALDGSRVAPLLNLGRIYEKTGAWSQAGSFYMKYMEHPGADARVKAQLEPRLRKINSLIKLEMNRKGKS